VNTIIDADGNEVTLEFTEREGYATYGHQGFKSAQAAADDAKITKLDDVVILRHESREGEYDYAWVWPRWYAERLLSTNVIEVTA